MQSTCSSSTEPVSSEPERAKLDSIPSEIRIRKLEDQISQLLQKVIRFPKKMAFITYYKMKCTLIKTK